MNHAIVRQINERVNELAQYCIREKITNGHVNWAISRNLKILQKAVEEIANGASQELKDIETKMYTIGKEKFDALPEEERKNLTQNDVFKLGFNELTKKEKDRQVELLEEFNRFLQQESDIELYKINENEIKECNIELQWMMFLNEFFVKE